MKYHCLPKSNTSHWDEISKLIADSIPNAVVSSLGVKCGCIYYRKISQSENSCCFIALDEDSKIAGVIIGTADCNTSKKLSVKDKIELVLAANIKLLSPVFLKWIAKGVLHKLTRQNQLLHSYPNSELIAIAVATDHRGSRLAHELLSKMEDFFSKKGKSLYCILTEKNNLRANKFYAKIGAVLIRTYHYHDREINEWHKELNK